MGVVRWIFQRVFSSESGITSSSSMMGCSATFGVFPAVFGSCAVVFVWAKARLPTIISMVSTNIPLISRPNIVLLRFY